MTTCDSRGGADDPERCDLHAGGPSLRHEPARPVYARLRLGPPGLDPATEPRHLVRDPAIALPLGLRCDEVGLELLLEVGLVVPGVARDAPARRDLHDPIDEVVEEVAVVRHEKEAVRVAVQLLLQPVHRVRVEVVRGLVEEQEIGPGEQGARDGDPLPGPAGELRHRPVPLLHPEPVEEPPRLVGGVPPPELLHTVRRRGEVGQEPLVHPRLVRRLEPPRERRVRVERRPERSARHLQLGGDRRARRELGLLRQVGDEGPAPELHLAAIGRCPAREDPHERGLAGPVHPDEPDPLALLEREGEPVEDGPASEREAEAGRVEERHGPYIASARAPRGRGSARPDYPRPACCGARPRACGGRARSSRLRRTDGYDSALVAALARLGCDFLRLATAGRG